MSVNGRILSNPDSGQILAHPNSGKLMYRKGYQLVFWPDYEDILEGVEKGWEVDGWDSLADPPWGDWWSGYIPSNDIQLSIDDPSVTLSPLTIPKASFEPGVGYAGFNVKFTCPGLSQVKIFNMTATEIGSPDMTATAPVALYPNITLTFRVTGIVTFDPGGSESVAIEQDVGPYYNNNYWVYQAPTCWWYGSHSSQQTRTQYRLTYSKTQNKWTFEIGRDYVICRFVKSGYNPRGTYSLDYTTGTWPNLGWSNFNCSGVTVDVI